MGHALDLKFLQLVVAVAEEGTLTRAGARLHLTQSALSHQLADLEMRFGVEVFRRQGRRLKLTPLGEHFVSRARLLLGQVEALETELMGGACRRQELRLVTQCFTCYHWIPTFIGPFEAAHPSVTISLVVESTRHALDALASGAADLAITTEQREDARYDCEFVFDDELVVALAPSHELANKTLVEFSDLGSERLLVHPPSDADRRWFQRAIGCNGNSPRDIQRLPVTDSIIELTANGYGCALLSRRSAAQAVARGRVVVRGFSSGPLMRSFFGVWRREDPKLRTMKEFVSALAEHCRT